MRTGKFEIYEDKKGEWRFNLKAGNGEIIAVSEGYKSKAGCLNGIMSIKKNANKAIIVDTDNNSSYTCVLKPRQIKKENKNVILDDKDLDKTIGKIQYTWKVVR